MNKSVAFKLAGAAALAGSTQAYGQIVPITGTALPSDLTVTPGGSSTEYYTILGGGSTSSSPGGDLKIDLFEDNSGNFSLDFLPVQTTDATTGFSFPASGATYGASYSIAAGAKVGTGSTDTPTFITVTPGYPFFSIAPFAVTANTPEFIGFQFTDPSGAPGNIHDGYLELESLSPGTLSFLGGAYNNTPEGEEGGAYITVEAIPEPGTISSLMLGAAALGGVGLLRRRRSILAQD